MPNSILPTYIKKSQLLILAVLVALSSLFINLTPPAYASVTKVMYRPDRHEATSLPSGSICIETTTVGTESSLTIVFPSQFTLSTTTTDWTMDTTANNIPNGSTQWPSTGSGNATSANNGTHTVVFAVGDVTASTFTCMHFTASGASDIGSAGNDLSGTIATNVDSATAYATSVVSSGGDQITVTATVPSTFTFSLGGSSAALGTLSTSSVTSATGVSATVSTNARLGWEMWVKNSTNGLYSTAGSAAIDAPGSFGSTYDLTSVTGYGLDVNSGSGSPTIDTAYNGSGDVNNVGVLQSDFKSIATKATAGSGDAVTLRFRAKVSATQAAGTDYTDTVTVAAAGNF